MAAVDGAHIERNQRGLKFVASPQRTRPSVNGRIEREQERERKEKKQ